MRSNMLPLSFGRLNVFVVLLTMADCGNVIFPDNNKMSKNHSNETPPTVVYNRTNQYSPPQLTSTVRPLDNSTVHLTQHPMVRPVELTTMYRMQFSTAIQQPTTIQPLQVSTPADAGAVKKQMLILGLYEAAVNIDKSLNSINVRDPKSDHNVIISPLCIVAALSLVLLGSRGESKTEISKLFGFDNSTLLSSTEDTNQNYKNLGTLLNNFQNNNSVENLGTQVNLAKTIFVQNGYNILTSYKTAAEEYLNSELVMVDFKSKGEQAQTTINQWVSNHTYGKINNIIQDTPLPETKTVIASALYFAGEWEHPFFVNYTRVKPFYASSNIENIKMSKHNTDVIYVSMMVGSSEVLYHTNEEQEFKAIGLPYKGKQFVTYFVLPDSNVTLRSLIAKMDGKTLKNITKYTNLTEFTYFIPKMTLESFTNLRPILQNIGINKIFDPTKADLKNMASDPGSYIGDILHKVEVVINEVGTVASAATAVTITRGGQSTFNINKPFLFFIHHVKSDTVVFWGSVNKPTPYSMVPSHNMNSRKKQHTPISVV